MAVDDRIQLRKIRVEKSKEWGRVALFFWSFCFMLDFGSIANTGMCIHFPDLLNAEHVECTRELGKKN